jgi:type IX secretion system PorP/SprF family membrane protein
MKNINKILYVLMTVIGFNTYAQDTRSSQGFYGTPLNINPAIMGMNSDLKLILNYRNQWKAIQSGYTNYNFNALFPLYLKDGSQKMDFGLSVNNNTQGAYSNLNAGLSIGYGLQINKSGFLSLAMQGTFTQNSLDATNLTFDDQYVLGQYSASNSTNQIISNQSTSFVNIGFGLMWHYIPEDNSKINAYAGVSAFNLAQPNLSYNTSIDPLYRRVSFQGGIKIIGDNKIDITPNIITNIQTGSNDLLAGIKFDYNLSDKNKVTFGVWYRKKDSYPIMLGVNISNFSLKYSYDVTNSILGNNISGLTTHELSLIFKLDMANKKGGHSIPSM